MKRSILFLFAAALQATTYYVGNTTGASDSNTAVQAQSVSTPWLTIQHSVNSMACGDTLIVISNGQYVQNADATFPFFANCEQTTTVEGQNLAKLAPAGYRTNPVIDSPNYGKLQFAYQGWLFQNEVHGAWVVSGNDISNGTAGGCGFSTISPTNGSGPSTFTVASCYGGLENLANGTQIEMELNGYIYSSVTSMPAPLKQYQVYYVVNCSTTPACNAGAGSYFQLAATPGGAPISVTACAAPGCNPASILFTQPLQVKLSTSTFTIPDSFIPCGASGAGLNICFQNGTPVTFNSVGLLSFAPVLPVPLATNTPYYVVNLSGSSFQVAASPGGPPITLTSMGTGPLTVATMQSPNNWAFRGLEFYYSGTNTIYGFLSLGSGLENSTIAMVHHMEVDRVYAHDNPTTQFGVYRSIEENGQYINIHDSYLSGNRAGESQAIQGSQALGPTMITNNFLEGSGENTLYGGSFATIGLANADHMFTGNYYYKPPLWKITQNTGAASGACWYDATDPQHAGGEWYYNSAASQWYQCNSSGIWATVPYGPTFSQPTVKDMAEHKSGTHFTYTGNLFNYVWASAQSGEVFNNSQEPGSGAGIANDHITVQNNKMAHALQFMVIAEYCTNTPTQPCPTTPGAHTYINNLLVIDNNACGVLFTTGTNSCGYQMTNINTGFPGLVGYLSNHNTIWTSDAWWGSGAPYDCSGGSCSRPYPPRITYIGANSPCGSAEQTYWVVQNSIIAGDLAGDCTSEGGVLSQDYTYSLFTNFATLKGTSGAYGSVGATNTWSNVAYPTTNATINYVNSASGDYHLSATSPYSAQNPSATLLSNDGTDLGADIDLLNMAISGAAAGTPTWDQQAELRISPGSSQVVFHYTAPNSTACLATVYSAMARITANQVTAVGDNATSSIANGTTREIVITGLAPTTHYWYKLACGGGVLMVGDFLTRATGHGVYQFAFDWSSPTPMQYSSSPSMAGAVSLTAATRQFIPVASNSLVYVQEGATGPITMLIAP